MSIVAKKGHTLFDLHPNLKSEWDYEKNSIVPDSLHPGTVKKVFWNCKEGHSFEKTIRSRTELKTSCPECNSFEFNFPKRAKAWHTKNLKRANEVSQANGQKVFWICEEGHEWEATPASRRTSGCPYCAGQKVSSTNNFKVKKPELAQYWDYKKNKVGPEEVVAQTTKRFWFKCTKKHSFDAKLSNIFNGKWCPYCSGQKVGYRNSLSDQNPTLAKEWHPTKNQRTASQFTPGANKKAWWICKDGHEWEALINARNKGNGCPFCSNRVGGYGNSLADHSPHLVSQINYKKLKVDPAKIVPGSAKEIWWICDRGHPSYKAPVRRRALQGTGCRLCSSQTSIPEIRLYCELKSVYEDAIGREKVEGIEADIIIPSLNLVIEYDGFHYHKDKVQIDKDKTKQFSLLGYTVMRLREPPLTIGPNDVATSRSRTKPTKDDINLFVSKIIDLIPEAKPQGEKYLKEKGYIADGEFRRILSYLPGPPEEDSLAKLHPKVSREWNFKKNYPLKPDMFHPRSGKKVWWICQFDHEYEATIDKRTGSRRGCPYCTNKKVGYGNSLHDKFPEIAAMWCQPGNGKVTPKDVTAGSGFHAWWQCESGHKYQTRVADKTSRNSGCKYCPGVGKNRKYIPPNV